MDLLHCLVGIDFELFPDVLSHVCQDSSSSRSYVSILLHSIAPAFLRFQLSLVGRPLDHAREASLWWPGRVEAFQDAEARNEYEGDDLEMTQEWPCWW